MSRITIRKSLLRMTIAMFFIAIASCGDRPAWKSGPSLQKDNINSREVNSADDASEAPVSMLVSPQNPKPGEIIHVLAVGSRSIHKAKIVVTSPSGSLECSKSRTGDGLPFWRIDEFTVGSSGKYQISLSTPEKSGIKLDFLISASGMDFPT